MVIVTACDPETQIRRIVERDSLTEVEARQRVASQLPIEEKVRRADHVIRTDGTYDDTDAQVRKVYEAIHPLGSRVTEYVSPAPALPPRPLNDYVRLSMRARAARSVFFISIVMVSGPDAAGHRRQRTGDFGHLGMHVAHEQRALRLEQLEPRVARRKQRWRRLPRRPHDSRRRR